MLMMKRRVGESILIGEDIEIHLAHIGRTRVKVGIKAPKELVVVAKEVKLVSEENRSAADSRPRQEFSALARALRNGNSCFPKPVR